jgi:hypothetical protein
MRVSSFPEQTIKNYRGAENMGSFPDGLLDNISMCAKEEPQTLGPAHLCRL